MKNTVILLSCLLGIIACQRDPSRTGAELQGSSFSSEPQLVQAADGTLYSKSCLQENASRIQSEGSSAIGTCQMNITTSSSGPGEVERTRFFHDNSYAWIWYPPTYWDSNSNNSSNFFCGWVFGGNYNFNCYALFGYTNYSNYSSYYNPTCNYCLYAPNPSRCQNRCVTYQYFYTY